MKWEDTKNLKVPAPRMVWVSAELGRDDKGRVGVVKPGNTYNAGRNAAKRVRRAARGA